MGSFAIIPAVIAAVFLVTAFRALRSGSIFDYLLAASQIAGVLLLFSSYEQAALNLLMLTAIAYLSSQVATGARPISRLLPVAGAAAIVLAIYLRP